MTRLLHVSLLCVALSACTPESGTPSTGDEEPPAEFVPLAPPEHGVQVHLEAFELAPGEEVERCWTVNATNEQPGTVVRVDMLGRPGLHHSLVYKVSQEQEEFDIPCFGFPDEVMEGFSVPEPLYASSSQVSEETLDFPEGVGVELNAGHQLMLNYHYINVTSEPIQAEVFVNLVFAPEGEEIEPAQFYAFGNISGVSIPAGGSQRLTTSCPFPDDINVFSVTPHMHQLGTAFEAFTRDGSGATEALLSAEGWENASSAYLDPPVPLQSGDELVFTCEWTNTTDQTVGFGQSFDNEMCFVFGFAYPAAAPIYAFDYDGTCTTEESVVE